MDLGFSWGSEGFQGISQGSWGVKGSRGLQGFPRDLEASEGSRGLQGPGDLVVPGRSQGVSGGFECSPGPSSPSHFPAQRLHPSIPSCLLGLCCAPHQEPPFPRARSWYHVCHWVPHFLWVRGLLTKEGGCSIASGKDLNRIQPHKVGAAAPTVGGQSRMELDWGKFSSPQPSYLGDVVPSLHPATSLPATGTPAPSCIGS